MVKVNRPQQQLKDARRRRWQYKSDESQCDTEQAKDTENSIFEELLESGSDSDIDIQADQSDRK